MTLAVVNSVGSLKESSAAGGGMALLDQQAGAVDNNNSAAETTLYTYTIPAGTIRVGDGIRVNFFGKMGRVAESLDLRFYLGGTVMSTANYNAAFANSDLNFTYDIGHWSTGNQNMYGTGVMSQNSKTIFGVATIDMTVAQILKITAQSSAAVNGSFLRRHLVITQQIRGS